MEVICVSSNYAKVKNYYKSHLWSIDRVKNAVSKKWITTAEYEEITGEKYAVE